MWFTCKIRTCGPATNFLPALHRQRQNREPKQLIYTSDSGLDTDYTYKRMGNSDTVHIAFNYKGGSGGSAYMYWVTCAPWTSNSYRCMHLLMVDPLMPID